MSKLKFIFVPLVLISLVLIGATCGEEERKKGKREEKQERLLEKTLTSAEIEDVLTQTGADLGWGSVEIIYIKEQKAFYVERWIEATNWGESYTCLGIVDFLDYSDEDFSGMVKGSTRETFIKKLCQLISADDPSMETESLRISGFEACYTADEPYPEDYETITRALVGNYNVSVEHWNDTKGELPLLDSRTIIKVLIDNLVNVLE